jgi:hypothetical protein
MAGGAAIHVTGPTGIIPRIRSSSECMPRATRPAIGHTKGSLDGEESPHVRLPR